MKLLLSKANGIVIIIKETYWKSSIFFPVEVQKVRAQVISLMEEKEDIQVGIQ